MQLLYLVDFYSFEKHLHKQLFCGDTKIKNILLIYQVAKKTRPHVIIIHLDVQLLKKNLLKTGPSQYIVQGDMEVLCEKNKKKIRFSPAEWQAQ